MEDILEKVDLSVVFEYQPVFEHASRLSEFKRLYIENREVAWMEGRVKRRRSATSICWPVGT